MRSLTGVMHQLRVVVANEPRAYREAIATVFQALRPLVVVIDVEPVHLDQEVLDRTPQLVICSWLTETVRARSLSWVVLYPDGNSRAVINVAGEQTTVTDIEFDRLLSVVDQTGHLTRS